MKNRKTFTINEEICIKLELVSRMMGFNQSALINKILEKHLNIDDAKTEFDNLKKQVVEAQQKLLL
jgi:hypothetical protein